MTRLRLSLLSLPLLIAAAPHSPNWAELLRQDAQAFHDDIAANHPGSSNDLDPGFAARNDRALARALRWAPKVTDAAGYRAAMDAYAASFDDGHLATAPTDAFPAIEGRWPGFLTGYGADRRYRVATRADDAAVPIGAALVSCDGVAAGRLAEERVGTFAGRWMLASRRALLARNLFLDRGNPFVARPRACRFAWNGATHEVALSWRALPADEAATRIAAVGGRAREAIGQRTLADGTRWLSLSGFNSDPSGPDFKALVPLIAALKADRTALARAPRIVLDLRGNNGGSSDWSRQIAAVLWGEAAVRGAEGHSEAVEWRVSPATIRAIGEYRDQFAAAPNASPDAKQWAQRTYDGLTGAAAKHQPLWRETDEPEATIPAKEQTVAPLAGPVFIVTDWGCGSACLDAVDLWRALGAIQVGQETSADTLYMDVRDTVLPSGMTRAVVPMKVYRGRKRGANQPWMPVHAYGGDLRDTAALQRWVSSLPDRGARKP
jgi:hypothetical protein